MKYLKWFSTQSRYKGMVEMAIFNVQRTVTPKLGSPQLCFINSAHCLENISNSFQVTEPTRVHGRNGFKGQ